MRLQEIRILHICVLFILPLMFFFSASKFFWLLSKYCSKSERGLLTSFQGWPKRCLILFACSLHSIPRVFLRPLPSEKSPEYEFKLLFPGWTPHLPNLNFWVGFRKLYFYQTSQGIPRVLMFGSCGLIPSTQSLPTSPQHIPRHSYLLSYPCRELPSQTCIIKFAFLGR